MPALPYPCLCLVTAPGICPPDELPARVAAAVAGGVDLVQLRDKDAPAGALYHQAVALRRVTQDCPQGPMRRRARLLINDRADIAFAAGAAGVQLGETAMPTAPVRALLGDDALLGRSVHSVPSAADAAVSGADFLLVGTMFPTGSHPGAAPAGPGLLRRIADAGVSLPLLGIGGVSADNVGQLLAAGAGGCAVITAILAQPDPETAARRLKSAMLDAAAALPPRPSASHSVPYQRRPH